MKVLPGKSWLAVTLLMSLGGCASIGPPEAPSLELPKAPTDLRATRKGNDVTLAWTIPARTTERQSVRYLGKTLVCRSLAAKIKECETAVGEVPAPAKFEDSKAAGKKLTARFVDKLNLPITQEHPLDFATYAVEVLNAAGRGAGTSNQVRVSLAPTLEPFSDFAAAAVQQGVMITWRCPNVPAVRGTGIRHLFRIYRRAEGSTKGATKEEKEEKEEKIGQVDAACIDGLRPGETFADLSPEKQKDFTISFLDQSFEWEKRYFYRGTVVSVVEDAGKPGVEIEGDDTPEVKVFAHDVFPPAAPEGLQAVFSGPGQKAFIDLIWSPVSDADLAGYNIYRREEGGTVAKMNAELVKTPAYRDEDVRAGKNYLYSVTAVDERGNESGSSEEAGEKVP